MTPIPTRYKLFFTVPPSSLQKCKTAVFATGAGTYPGGKYTHVAFETTGLGQFLPGQGANPNIGAVGNLEKVEETKVEVLCVGKGVVERAVEALKG